MSQTLDQRQPRHPVDPTPPPVSEARPAVPDDVHDAGAATTYPLPSVVAPKDPVKDPNDPTSPSGGYE